MAQNIQPSTTPPLARREDTGMRKELRAPMRVAPRCAIYESDDDLVVLADLPGCRSENSTVQFQNDTLTVRGKRPGIATGEAVFGDTRPVEYERSVLLPKGLEAERIQATMKNGVLTVTLPKSAAIRPRTVKIAQA
jgi:HSP20 family molecular chaperone IbpA